MDTKLLKNSAFLYGRFILNFVLTLLVVRLMITVFGLEKYGVFEVVFGFVTSLSLFTHALTSTSQRFFSTALGKNDEKQLWSFFTISQLTLVILGFFMVVTVYFLSEKIVYEWLVIPKDLWVETRYLLIFSTLIFFFQIIRIPITSYLIAQENFLAFSVVSLGEAVMKFIVFGLLLFLGYNSFVSYGIGYLIFSILFSSSIVIYAVRKYHIVLEKKIQFADAKDLLSFGGWSFFSVLVGVANNQGNTLLINQFFPVLINAAKGVSGQVSSALNSLSNSFFFAIRPRIIKEYSAGNLKTVSNLFFDSSRIALLASVIFGLPLYFFTEEILNLWLTSYSRDTVDFVRLSIVFSVVYCLQNPITSIVHASGRIKMYSLYVEPIIFLIVPITYFLYTLGWPAKSFLYISILCFSVAHLVRLWILKRIMSDLSIWVYVKQSIFPNLILIIGYSVLFYGVRMVFNAWFGTLIVMSLLSAILTYFVVLSSSERNRIKGLFS